MGEASATLLLSLSRPFPPLKKMTKRVIQIGLSVHCCVFAQVSLADSYRFNDAVGNDWMNGRNWQNQTAGALSVEAGTIAGLQIRVDQGGSLTLNAGALLITDSGNCSGMGAGSSRVGVLTNKETKQI